MKDYVINKIKCSNILYEPYPHIKIDDFFPKKFSQILELPDYKDIDDEVYFQDSKRTKKSIVDNISNNKNYHKLLKNSNFNEIDKLFKEDEDIKDIIFDKFKNNLEENIVKKPNDLKTSVSINYSVSIPGYSKEIHIDRREHLINILYYHTNGDTGVLELWKEKNIKEDNDIFPPRYDMKLSKIYKPKKNTAIIMINLPWSYHSVSVQESNFLNRKYIYVVWDFEKYSRENKDNNVSLIWKKKTIVKDDKRKENFINLVKNN